MVLVKGFVSWWLLIQSGSLQCMPLAPPSFSFAASRDLVAYSSTVTRTTGVLKSDGEVVLRLDDVSEVALSPGVLWVTGDGGHQICRRSLPQVTTHGNCVTVGADFLVERLRGTTDAVLFWVRSVGTIETDIGGLPAGQYVRSSLRIGADVPEKFERIVAEWGPTWCTGDGVEYSFVRNGILSFGGDANFEGGAGSSEVPCSMQGGILAYGQEGKVFVGGRRVPNS